MNDKEKIDSTEDKSAKSQYSYIFNDYKDDDGIDSDFVEETPTEELFDSSDIELNDIEDEKIEYQDSAINKDVTIEEKIVVGAYIYSQVGSDKPTLIYNDNNDNRNKIEIDYGNDLIYNTVLNCYDELLPDNDQSQEQIQQELSDDDEVESEVTINLKESTKSKQDYTPTSQEEDVLDNTKKGFFSFFNRLKKKS